jgi:glutamyl/glutaminyl-tRNA synthetase
MQKRLIKGSVEDIHRILMWTGLSPHEGPHTTNSIYGSYIQSERLHIYKQYLSKLQDMDVVYPCFCSSETLDKLNAKQKQNK